MHCLLYFKLNDASIKIKSTTVLSESTFTLGIPICVMYPNSSESYNDNYIPYIIKVNNTTYRIRLMYFLMNGDADYDWPTIARDVIVYYI